MVDRNFEGFYTVLYAPDGAEDPGVADLTAPTVAEATAATNLTPQLPTGGVAWDNTENNSSLAMILDGFVSESVGTEASTFALTLKRDDDPEDDPTYMFTKGETGTMIIIPMLAANDYTPADGDKCHTLRVEAHPPAPLTPAENTKQQVRVNFAVAAREVNAEIDAGS